MSVRPHPLSRGRPLVCLAISLLALAAVVTWALDAPDPESPATPAAPQLSMPQIGNPDVAAPTPSLSIPKIGPPRVSVATPSLPRVGNDSRDQSGSREVPAGSERRTVSVHDHHRTYLWQFELPPLVLALAGLAALYPFARMPRQGQRVFGTMIAASLIALSIVAFAAGINPQSGPGRYEREPPEVERSRGFLGFGPETVVRRVHAHHFHPPTYLAAHWLLASLGLAVLAIPGARVGATKSSKHLVRKVGQVTA